jgi:two-component system response regulator CpxR
MNHPTILLIDDDRELCLMLEEYLSSEGFAVLTSHSGADALAKMVNQQLDLVLLDVMLPSLDGFGVLRMLPHPFHVPIIMLTARGDDDDRILGLELGANDYIAKPFNPNELVARIRAVLRRARRTGESAAPTLSVGPLELDRKGLEARLNGSPLSLTGSEFRILEALMQAPGQTQSREALTERVLGRKPSAFDRSIDTHVNNLRRKIEAGRAAGVEIRNIRGHGYVLTVVHQD